MTKAKKIITKLLLLAGIALFWDGIFVAIRTNLKVGTLLTLLAGAVLMVYGIWYKKIEQLTAKGIGRVLKYIVLVGICFVLVMVIFLASQAFHDTVTYDEDAVVVLGAAVHGDKVSRSLAHRLDKAAEYAEENPDAIIVVSGGQGMQETVTEAFAMEQYLLKKGLDAKRIIKEEKATSTYENFHYSKEILDEVLGDQYTCAYVTNGYHTYRAGKIAERAGMQAEGLGTYTDWWYTPSSYLRETLAVVKFWVFRR